MYSKLTQSKVPTDRRYKASHEWAKLDGEVATVGITDFAQSELGDIVFADLPEIGTQTSAGESAATVESVKTAAEIYAPVGGEIVAVNEKLEDSAGLINEEPFGDGWLFQLKVSDTAEFDSLMDAAAYEKVLEEKDD